MLDVSPHETPPMIAATPRHCLLSNGRSTVMLDRHGAGFSRWRDLAVTRWREDPVVDGWGSWLLLRDEDSGEVRSPTRQPFGHDAPDDAVQVEPGRATFRRRHHSLHSTLEMAVAADADVELRRLTLSNHGDRVRRLSITSCAELVLGPAGADDAHPAFSKMFVRTEWDAASGLLLGTRRKRSNDEATIWAAQALRVVGTAETAAPEVETDRMAFLGRGRTLRHAQALQAGAALGGGSGCVLDPVFAQRRHFTLAPDSEVTVLLWTRLADSRDGVLALAAQAGDADAAARLFDGATQQAQARLREFGIDDAEADRAAHWLDALLVSDAAQRAAPEAIAQGRGGAPTLWAAGISGDRPIALLRLHGEADLPRVQELLSAQQLWHAQRCAMDVVLLDAGGAAAQTALAALVQAQQAQLKADETLPKAELFALQEGAIGDELRDGLACVARLVLDGEAAARPAAANAASTPAPPLRATAPARELAAAAASPEFPNGIGGFVEQGRAYRIELAEGRCTPQPWVNVIANPTFGFLVSAEGGGYAWSINSQQNPLTPWPNDPVSDCPHEVLYLRDADNGALWSATAAPIRVAGANYATTHGRGWSCFETDAHGIALELMQCVPVDDSLKLARLRLANRSARTRRLSLTAYVEWALGPNGSVPAPFVQTARDLRTGALFARNRWRPDFGERVAFADLGGAQQSMSGDRAAFLGPLGTP